MSSRAAPAAQPRTSIGAGIGAAVGGTLRLTVPAAGILALIETVDTVATGAGSSFPIATRLLLLASVASFYVVAGLLVTVPQAIGLAVVRRWRTGGVGWDRPFLLEDLTTGFARRPRLWGTVLAAAAVLLPAAFYLGVRSFRFAIDAKFELAGAAAAAMSWFHLVLLGAALVASCGLGYLGARIALWRLSAPAAFRILGALPVLCVGAIGYSLYTRVFARILDMRWLTWLSFLLAYGCVQVLLLLLLGRRGQRSDRDPSAHPLRRLVAHRWFRLAGLVAVGAAVSVGVHAFSDFQLVRFQVFRQARFAPELVRTLTSVLDRDGDGHLAILGGLDCDDSDPRRHPDAYDRASDGHDDNCVAGDPKREEIVSRWLAERTANRVRLTANLPVERRKYNILLVTIDSCRPDHMSLYGYGRRTTPNLERLGSEGLVFTRAHSQGNFTDLSLYSLLTGLYPSSFVLGERIVAGVSIAGLLKRHGYDTHALNDLPGNRGFLAHGFDRFDNTLAVRNKGAVQNQTATSSGADITALAESFLRGRSGRKRPFLLWIHYMDPHSRYLTHKGLSFGDSERDRYDSEIAFTDRQIGRLVGTLRQRGLYDSTVVVVGSDHGEAFGEHGFFTHGHTLYQEEIHVPLVIRIPGVAPTQAARRVGVPVENVDIVPTLLDLVGYEHTLRPMHGESLLGPAYHGRALRSPGVFAEHRHKGGNAKMLRVGRWKIIYDVRDSYFELYDLGQDARERHNLADSHPRTLATLQATLYKWMDLWLNGFKTHPIGHR